MTKEELKHFNYCEGENIRVYPVPSSETYVVSSTSGKRKTKKTIPKVWIAINIDGTEHLNKKETYRQDEEMRGIIYNYLKYFYEKRKRERAI